LSPCNPIILTSPTISSSTLRRRSTLF